MKLIDDKQYKFDSRCSILISLLDFLSNSLTENLCLNDSVFPFTLLLTIRRCEATSAILPRHLSEGICENNKLSRFCSENDYLVHPRLSAKPPSSGRKFFSSATRSLRVWSLLPVAAFPVSRIFVSLGKFIVWPKKNYCLEQIIWLKFFWELPFKSYQFS